METEKDIEKTVEAGKERTSRLEDLRPAAAPHELMGSSCLPYSCDPEHGTYSHRPLSKRVRQCGTARVNAVCSPCQPACLVGSPGLPTYVTPSPAKSTASQLLSPSPPSLRTRSRPQSLLYTPTSLPNNLLQGCVEMKRDCTKLKKRPV